MSATQPVQITRDNNSTFVIGDQYGIWIADSGSGTPYVRRYAQDSGRWIVLQLTNAVPFPINPNMGVPTTPMANDEVNQKLYVLQNDGAGNTYLTVIDTTASGSTTYGVTAINGIVNTFSITDQLGGGLNYPYQLLWDATSATLWTFALSSTNNTHQGFYQIDPTTGATTYYDVQSDLMGFQPEDLFAAGGFLYVALHESTGYLLQFDTATVTLQATSVPIYNGGANSGYLQGFDYDPNTGYIVATPNSGDQTNFGTTGGYVVFDPSNSLNVISYNSAPEATCSSFDSSGNVWNFVRGGLTANAPGWVGPVISITVPTTYLNSSPYSAAWVGHLNGNPNLFAVDLSGVSGNLYAASDDTTFLQTYPLNAFAISNTSNSPNTTHVNPLQIVTDDWTAYPTQDQLGLWIGSTTKLVRYSPDRGSASAFLIVPLPDSTVIPANGIAKDESSNNRIYVLDQANSYIWIVSTEPILVSGKLAGVGGILGYFDLTFAWPANTATFSGLVFDWTSSDLLLISDGSPGLYSLSATGSFSGAPGAYGTAYQSLYLAPISGVQPRVLATGTNSENVTGWESDYFNPYSFAGTQNVWSYPQANAVGQSASRQSVSSNNSYVYMAGQDGDIYAASVIETFIWNPGGTSGSGQPRFGNTFTGESTTLYGAASGGTVSQPSAGSPSVWIAFNVSGGANYIENYGIGGDNVAQVYAKILPSPYGFAPSGNYGQGSYGFGWLGTPVNKIFASDIINNELWSGGANSSDMAVETTFPYMPPPPPPNYNFSFDPNPVGVGEGTLGGTALFNIVTTFNINPDTITDFAILSGAWPGAVLDVSGLPAPAGTTFAASLSAPPGTAFGNYTVVIQGTGAVSGAVNQDLFASVWQGAETVYNPIQWFEAYDLSLPPPPHGFPAEIVYPRIRWFEAWDPNHLPPNGFPAETVYLTAFFEGQTNFQLTTYYYLRAASSASSDGYIFWVNTTGDNTGRPNPPGTIGPTIIVAMWED